MNSDEARAIIADSTRILAEYGQLLEAMKVYDRKAQKVFYDSVEYFIHLVDTRYSIRLRTQKRPVVTARQYASYLLNHKLKVSLTHISTLLGEATSDHATVLHGVRRAQNYLDTKDSILMDCKEEIDSIYEKTLGIYKKKPGY